MQKYLTLLGFLLLFLFPVFFNPFFFIFGLVLIYISLYRKLEPKKLFILTIGLLLNYPLYYFISLIFHKKVLFNNEFVIKVLLSYILFIIGNYLIFLIFKNTKNEFRKLAIKFLFFGALGGVFLVGIMVSWMGFLVLGLSFLGEGFE